MTNSKYIKYNMKINKTSDQVNSIIIQISLVQKKSLSKTN